MELETFIARVSQRPLPDSPMARIKTLAKELAEGAVEEVWETYFLAGRYVSRTLKQLHEKD